MVKQDYYSVLARAVAALDPQDAESRLAVYDRARYAMARAPLTLDEIRQQRIALEAAIRRIEDEIASGGGVPAPGAADRPPDHGTDALAPPLAASSRRAHRSWYLVVSACAAVVILIAGVAGYRYWHKPVDKDVGTLAQAPMTPANADDRSRAQTPIRISARPAADARPEENRSYIFKRQLVYYRSIHPTGSIVIAKAQNFLYFIRPNTAAVRYTIGVGAECSNVVGLLLVSAKEDWSAGGSGPQVAGKDAQPALRTVAGRFGARSLALSDTGYRIHGSEEPPVGRVIGCFPLVNEDVIDLYERVTLGTRVIMN
jgi:lipoprotein-anchoring transpeptidase ErfK/SrfK